MSNVQKIFAAIAGLGVLGLALTFGLALLGLALILAPVILLYGNWKMKQLRREFEKRAGSRENAPDVIEADYVVIDEKSNIDSAGKDRH